LLEEGLMLRREMADASGIADATLNLAMVATGVGELDRARTLSEEALAMYRRLGNSHHAANCIENLG
jgi:hypothetical protein